MNTEAPAPLTAGMIFTLSSGQKIQITEVTRISVFFDKLTPTGERVYQARRLPTHEFRRYVGI